MDHRVSDRRFLKCGHVCVGCSDRGSFANPHLENFDSWICSSTYGLFLYLSEVDFYKAEKSMAYDRIRTCILSIGVSDSDPPLYDHGYLGEACLTFYSNVYSRNSFYMVVMEVQLVTKVVNKI